MVKHAPAIIAIIALTTIILAMWFGVVIGRSACDVPPAGEPVALRGSFA